MELLEKIVALALGVFALVCIGGGAYLAWISSRLENRRVSNDIIRFRGKN